MDATLLRLLMMRKVATKTTIRINIAPPIMPPNSGVDKPPFDDPIVIPLFSPVDNPLLLVAIGVVFAIGFGADVTLAIMPSPVVVVVDVGASRMVLEIIVDIIVVGFEAISSVVYVPVKVKVEIVVA